MGHILEYLGYRLSKKEGKYYYGGSLYLQGTAITALPPSFDEIIEANKDVLERIKEEGD